MAGYFLCNPVYFGGKILTPGKHVLDTVYSISALLAAGALLWPDTDPVVAAAAAIAVADSRSKGQNETFVRDVMRDGMLSSLLGGSSGGGFLNATIGASGATTVIAKTTGWFLGDTTTGTATFTLPPGADGNVLTFQVGAGQGLVVVNSVDANGNQANLIVDPNTNTVTNSFTLSGLGSSKQFVWNAHFGRYY